MFTDIKDFTAFSERLDPDQLADALGRYLDTLTRVIQHEGRGAIDKFIGDSIMAIWNAPELAEDHAALACHSALRCRDAACALASAPEWQGLPMFETRIGLHCGSPLVGHFGAHERMNYTAIGDAVNLASRLEGLNKLYGTSIIVSEAIVTAVNGRFTFRLLDRVTVKGKTEAISIYELRGESATPAATDAVCADYERAFAAFCQRDFAGAAEIVRPHADIDPPSAALLRRCTAFIEDPPEPEWDGVRHLDAK
jgi:adenylate cyclase